VKLWNLFLALVLMSVSQISWSQEVVKKEYETVIERPVFQSTNRVILDQKKIQETKAPNLTTLLATQANLTVSNSNFQPGAIYLRGGDAGHILILVDGLPFYDASTLQRTVNLNDFDIKTIRRIEILKGSQSVLYGGQALSGVIKIETFPREMTPKYGAAGELGERNYRKVSAADFQPVSENSGVLVRAQASARDNRSPVLDSSLTYPSQLLSGDLGFMTQGTWNFFVKAQQINDKTHIANSNPATYQAVDAQQFIVETDIKGLSMGASSSSTLWRPQILAGYQISDRSFTEDPVTNSKYGGSLWNIRLEATPLDLEEVQILTGASYLKESFVYREAGAEVADSFNEQKGLFVKATYEPTPIVALESGVRTDFYKNSNHTESAQLGVTLYNALKFEYSTGFKAPSLSQLYSNYGNPDLQPEKSQSLSVSYETQLGQSQSFSASIFQTRLEGLIAILGTNPGRLFNVAKAETKGAEVQYSAETNFRLRTDLALGYQEPRDLENDRWLLRRPRESGSIRLTQKFGDTYAVGVEVLGNGERLDYFGGGQYGTLPAYFLTNVFASKALSENSSLYIRGSNVANDRYEDSRGYFNEGAFYFAGIEISN
jgi:iron complex outermembrane receptor protein